MVVLECPRRRWDAYCTACMQAGARNGHNTLHLTASPPPPRCHHTPLPPALPAVQVGVHCHTHARLLRGALEQRDRVEAALEAELAAVRARAAAHSAAAAEAQRRERAAADDAAATAVQCAAANATVEQLREEVVALKTKRDEMVLKYRRCALHNAAALWHCVAAVSPCAGRRI
jgi:hypothetical protein